MKVTVSPKWPGISAMIVLGLFIGAIAHKDFLTAMVVGFCFLWDCCKFEKVKD